MKHLPVMLEESINYLNIKKNNFIIDATFGYGGHSAEILKKIGKNGKLLTFEKDENSYKNGILRFKNDSNIQIINQSYENMGKMNLENQIDGILFDLGVSSMQLDTPEKGFSFMKNGPLDMRFSEKQILTAEYIVNNYSYENLKNIFKKYGEEKNSSLIANAICYYREKIKKIETTFELKSLIEKKIQSNEKKHPATRVFQALRIEVNNEIDTIIKGINEAIKILKPNGRIVIISFHSIEDRIVKNIFNHEQKQCICPPKIPICKCNKKQRLKIITKKSINPTEIEIQKNPRSRSAILRCAEKI